jgi:hypothetical protein
MASSDLSTNGAAPSTANPNQEQQPQDRISLLGSEAQLKPRKKSETGNHDHPKPT